MIVTIEQSDNSVSYSDDCGSTTPSSIGADPRIFICRTYDPECIALIELIIAKAQYTSRAPRL
jgi:hypothetical protein